MVLEQLLLVQTVHYLVDGVSLDVGDRILVKDQTTQTQNGFYKVTTVGSGSAVICSY